MNVKRTHGNGIKQDDSSDVQNRILLLKLAGFPVAKRVYE